MCLNTNLKYFSPKGIIERDQIVFQEARQRGIPIFMLTSGGYQVETKLFVINSLKVTAGFVLHDQL